MSSNPRLPLLNVLHTRSIRMALNVYPFIVLRRVIRKSGSRFSVRSRANPVIDHVHHFGSNDLK
jgi:hypothetical protein